MPKNKILLDVLEFSGDGEKNIGVRRFNNHLPTDLVEMEKVIKDFGNINLQKITNVIIILNIKKLEE